MSRTSSIAVLSTGLLASGLIAAGPDIVPLVEEGDVVPGVGNVTSIANLTINDLGLWIIEVDTDNADTDADSILIRGGTSYLREGQEITDPAASSLDSFDANQINSFGASAFNLFLDGTSGSNDNSGVYFAPGSQPFDLVKVVQESEEAPGLTAGTPFIGFFEVRINDAEQIFTMASVDDPNINSSVDRAMHILTTDSDLGGITDFTLIAAEGDVLPGQTEAVSDFGTGPHEMAFNNDGHVLFGVDLTGDSSTNAAVYHYAHGVEGTAMQLIAQEGSFSPLKDRTWATLTSIELDLNNNGDHVYSGSLDGDSASNLLLVRNGEKFVQEGDAVTTDSGTWAFTSFGSGPLSLNDCGEVLWYGDWNDPDTDVDTGLFIDGTLIVQEGVTTIDGVVVDTLRGVTDGYAMSRNGRWVVFEAILADGTEGAYMIDRGADACPPACAADFDEDGSIGVGDLLLFLQAWGSDDLTFDIAPEGGDGQVGVLDLLAILEGWGPCR